MLALTGIILLVQWVFYESLDHAVWLLFDRSNCSNLKYTLNNVKLCNNKF